MAFPQARGEIARLTRDVEISYTGSGKALAKLGLAFNKRQKNRDTGEWEDAGTVFVNATAWEQLAENIANSNLAKGTEVIVSGEYSTNEYDKKDGGKGFSLDLRLFSLGVSLSGATAAVSKVGREAGGGGSQGGFGGGQPATDPWAGVSPTVDPNSPPF